MRPEEAVQTLFDWAGGAEAFRRLIDRFYDRVEGDDLISPLFPGSVTEAHRAHVTAWWIEVFGGSATYTEQLGGYRRTTTATWPSPPSSASGSSR